MKGCHTTSHELTYDNRVPNHNEAGVFLALNLEK